MTAAQDKSAGPRVTLHRTDAGYSVHLGGRHIGDVLKHKAAYGTRVLWNAYLPGEVEAFGVWSATRRGAVAQLVRAAS